ncbi:fructokinase [Marinomonas sp. SBI22]|uniref:carbohydrate kinase family protein n=1 Tax=unclassified Marinomonas TaxID=196814 RepID=UPI0007AF1B15|nr:MULTISPECIES: carbohydrate kinase [unclassified Marinomonas]KZM40654.1 fructokinase [Marinomonas sp. SBI22]KZM42355.1 fructokinase [Marinomonas sp. SBI8L]
MQNTKLIAFGEALIDFLSSKTANEGQEESFVKYPGGAPANVAVAAAKLGVNSHFVGQVGDDSFGHFLADCLAGYGVQIENMRFSKEAKTALAFVSLDNEGERTFEFYRQASADILYRAEYFNADWFKESQGVFHTCSNTLTDENITQATLAGMAMAEEAGWLISCDVNLRSNLWPDHKPNTQRVIDWMMQAHVIKASLEELAELTQDPMDLIKQTLTNQTQIFVLTDGAKSVRYFTRSHTGEVATPKVEVKDTTAAGDAFVGGLLAQLIRLAPSVQACAELAEQDWQSIIQYAVASGACAVTEFGAYPALPNQEQVNAILIN